MVLIQSRQADPASRWLSAKESTCNAGDARDANSVTGSEDALEEGLATHSSILAWKIPRTEEPGQLQSMGSQSLIRLKQPIAYARCTHANKLVTVTEQSLNTDPHKYENVINDRTLKIIYK